MKNQELIDKAKSLAKKLKTSPDCVCCQVGSALLTDKGNVYTGVSFAIATQIGSCAEPIAVANMLAARESRIESIVAVNHHGKVIPPCGRCRELIYEVNHDNLGTNVIVSEDNTKKLSELLPDRWQDSWGN